MTWRGVGVWELGQKDVHKPERNQLKFHIKPSLKEITRRVMKVSVFHMKFMGCH